MLRLTHLLCSKGFGSLLLVFCGLILLPSRSTLLLGAKGVDEKHAERVSGWAGIVVGLCCFVMIMCFVLCAMWLCAICLVLCCFCA